MSQDGCTHELTEAVVACTGPVLDQGSQHFDRGKCGTQQTLPLAEQLLAADGCCRRVS